MCFKADWPGTSARYSPSFATQTTGRAGETKDDYLTTEQSYTCLQVLLDFVDHDSPDEVLVDGYADNNKKILTPLRMERLSKDVLLCLFAGKVTAVDIHQKPETLHFGFNRPDSLNSSDYSKDNEDKKVRIDWKDQNKRVVDISKLADRLTGVSECHSAMFALAMIEGVEGVRFQQTSSNSKS